MEQVRGKWALVTGASSGIGRDFAFALAEKGAHVVLVARRVEAMERVAEAIRAKHQVEVRVEGVDLAVPGAAGELKQRLDADGVQVEVLINNAGAGVIGEFVDQPLEKIVAVLQLNVVAMTEVTHVFAKAMKERRSGYVVLVGSMAAYQPCPIYAAYAGTKAYVLMMGEALHTELAAYNVGVTVLSPGVTETEFFETAGGEITAAQKRVMMKSRTVVDIGLAAMLKKKSSVVPGVVNRVGTFSARLFPRQLSSRIAYKLMK